MVPVKNERVRVFLLSVTESEKQMVDAENVDSKVSVCETLLKELIDAQQALRDDLKDDQVSCSRVGHYRRQPHCRLPVALYSPYSPLGWSVLCSY